MPARVASARTEAHKPPGQGDHHRIFGAVISVVQLQRLPELADLDADDGVALRLEFIAAPEHRLGKVSLRQLALSVLQSQCHEMRQQPAQAF